tara:strand:- start:22 stop:465 length:444 start_codon:yes stop_codon:yes gene_type:complete
MCAKEKFFQNLVAIMGSPELSEDPRFKTFADRMQNREILGPLLKNLSLKKTTTEWLDKLRGKVPCAPVNTVEQALSDPQIEYDEMVISTEHPTLGTIRQPANPIKISSALPKHQIGPALGQHTTQILQEHAGATLQEIAEWRDKGIL